MYLRLDIVDGLDGAEREYQGRCVDTDLVKGGETRTKGSSIRSGEELEYENLKKQKLDENVEAEFDDDQEEA
ncbi:hypothetical protein Tco_0234391 [Tanacetum coccineum]